MAHANPGRGGRLRAAGAFALGFLAASTTALALDVGEPRVRSAIGEPLDASLPVRANPGERYAGKCFSVAPGDGLPEDPGLGVTLERSRGRSNLRVRTGKAIAEPAIGLKVGVDCEKSGRPMKDVPLLIDLPTRPRTQPAPAKKVEAPAARETASLPDASAEMPKSAAAASTAPRAATRIPAPGEAPKASPDARPPKASPKAGMPQASARPESAKAATPAARVPGPGFQLKLSGAEMDLAPSRNVDDRQREALRGRLALLDADDQLSAMLAMRHQLQQLESKVAALQLKVAQMPESFPPPKAKLPAPAVEAPKPAATTTPVVEAPKPAPFIEPPKPAPTPAPVVEAPKPPPVVEAPKPVPGVETPKPAPGVEVPRPAPTPAKPKPASARPAPPPTPGLLDDILASLQSLWIPIAAAVLGLGVLALLVGWWRRRRGDAAAPADGDAPPTVAIPDEESIANEPGIDLPLGEIAAEIEAPAAAAVPAAPAIAEPAIPPAAELLPDDAASVRQRYIAERFPEVARGSIDLADPESVIKGARLFYEDGELPRAVELLQYAIETNPDEPRPWLALFEIFRLERLGGEFSHLAARFRERFGDTEHWQKVRYFGREVDAGNALYRDEAPSNLETIGPREARRLAAQNVTYDPVTENWLRAPMDFQNEVLATELRRALMADAALAEADLVPNPMPALRDIEMFTVA